MDKEITINDVQNGIQALRKEISESLMRFYGSTKITSVKVNACIDEDYIRAANGYDFKKITRPVVKIDVHIIDRLDYGEEQS